MVTLGLKFIYLAWLLENQCVVVVRLWFSFHWVFSDAERTESAMTKEMDNSPPPLLLSPAKKITLFLPLLKSLRNESNFLEGTI